jgi:hypothetical protein
MTFNITSRDYVGLIAFIQNRNTSKPNLNQKLILSYVSYRMGQFLNSIHQQIIMYNFYSQSHGVSYYTTLLVPRDV